MTRDEAEVALIKASPEYKRLKALLGDPEWRIDNLYFIRNEEGTRVKFVRNEAQRAFQADMALRNVLPKARKLGFCHAPHMRVLTADLRWVRIDEIEIGQEIVAVDEDHPGGKGNQRRMRLGVVQAKREVFEVAYRIRLDNGVELVATGPHRYLSKRREKHDRKRDCRGQIMETMWRPVAEMIVGDKLRYITEPWDEPGYEDGWLGGFLDGEGSVRGKTRGGFEITISQTPGAALDRARQYLAQRGYAYREEIDSRTHPTAYGTRTKGLHKLIVSRMNEGFRLIGQTRPVRLSQCRWWQDKELPGKKSGAAWAEVVSIERLEAQRMIDIQTSTGTFICEGIVSHNSTLIAILICDRCVFRSNHVAGIVDITLDDATVKLSVIKYAYDNLPEDIRKANPLVRNNDHYLEWANGSNVSVGTTYRGDTPADLHVSEYGKVSADNPEGAREIKTGAIQAVPATGRIWVESTAHGTSGEFCDMVRRAQALAEQRAQLTHLDFKFHFFGWWIKKEYRIPNNLVVVPHDLAHRYFPEVEAKIGRKLDADQQAWYAKKLEELGPDDIKSEFPSTADELFFVSLEGAYWREEISRARREERIGKPVPYDPTRSVNTGWDIGENCTAIWWHQTDGVRHRFIDYWEEQGASLQRACNVIEEKRLERKFVYGTHYGPHDLDHKDWAHESQSRKKTALDLGVKFEVVPRVLVKADSIEAGRRLINNSWFDAERCGVGVSRIENYRKRWNKQMAQFTSDPLEDGNDHGSDALQGLAMGLKPEKVEREGRSRDRRPPRTTSWSA